MGGRQSKAEERDDQKVQKRSYCQVKSSFPLLKLGSHRRDHQSASDNSHFLASVDNFGKRHRHSVSICDLQTDRKHANTEEEELQLVSARTEDIPEEERGTCFVNLIKKEGSGMGLTLSGGADRESRPRVSNLRSSGLAAKSDQLQVGDYITAVNGIRTSKLKHGEIISLLKNVGEKVTLEIEYHLPPITVQTSIIIQKVTDISLKKDEASFGFVLRGGGHEQYRKSRSLVVTYIRPDSSAHREGSLKTGDRILAVDGNPTSALCLEEANSLLLKCGDTAVFTIEYDVSVMDAVKNATGPLLVEVSKTPGVELGITLAKSTLRKKAALCIDRVKPASIADRCGALHVGDQILSIDNVSTDNGGVNVQEASAMLTSASDQIKIEILPVSHLTIAATKTFGQSRFAPVITGAHSMSALHLHRSSMSRLPIVGQSSTFGRGGNRWTRRKPQKPITSSAMSLVSTDYFATNHVVHAEIQEILLLTSDDGCDLVTSSSSSLPNFGIQLQGGVFQTEILHPLINYIEPERAADRSGLLQSGDRLLSVNGYACEHYTVEEVYQLLADSYYAGRVILEIEFDVAESVVPSSGTFHAKIPKRRGVDIGIVIAAGSANMNTPLMISEVLKGSAAHRTGTLEAGDKILAIDGVTMDGCSVEDARDLLASAEDVVRLKIRKDEENSDDADSNTVSYTVELKRHGGPLGITISGTEEPFDPIFISGLTPGGLAARTGAIREGDKIQSINNISLRSKPLSEAIALLQSAGEVVLLKIRRDLSTVRSSPLHKDDSPLPSRVITPTSSPANQILNEGPSELSDPEDDILPPPMGTLSNHPHFSDPTSTPNSQTPSVISITHLKDCGFRPGPAGAPSVDSAVDSWEGSSGETQRTRSSNESRHPISLSPSVQDGDPRRVKQPGFKIAHKQILDNSSKMQKRSDPGANVEKLRTKFETAQSRSYSDQWGTREQIRARAYRSPERSRPPPSADWQSALDDLQSVGQSSDYLKDLETKLTIGSELEKYSTYRQPSSDDFSSYKTPLGGAYDTLPLNQKKIFNFKAQQPHRLKLVKENRNEEFGFSMSDSQVEVGVYVHTVKPGSPACRAGLLPYDRVLQVNGISTHDADCSMVIALVSPSQTQLDILITRYPRTVRHSPHVQLQNQPLLSPPLNLQSPTNESSSAFSKW